MSIENGTVHWRQILRFLWLTQAKFYQKDQNKFWNEKSDKNISANLDYRTESIEIGIFEHGTFLSDSIEKKKKLQLWKVDFTFQ